MGFKPGRTKEELKNHLAETGLADKLAMIYVETPANPTNDLIDISMCTELAKELSTDDKRILVAVDNTYMGPLW